MQLIGIGHRSEHGKDTFANYIIEHYKNKFPSKKIIKLNWAWKLKDIAYQLYSHLGLREPEFYDTDEGRAFRNIKLPRINLTPVEIWIKLGTDAVREQVWDATWVEWLRNSPTLQDCDVVIAPDTRFHNEIEYCDYTIKITNPRIANRKGKSVDDVLADYTGWNLMIDNFGSKQYLNRLAGNLVDLFWST